MASSEDSDYDRLLRAVPSLRLVELELRSDLESQGASVLLSGGQCPRLRELIVQGAIEDRVLSRWRIIWVARRLSMLLGPTAPRGDTFATSPASLNLALQHFQQIIDRADEDLNGVD